WEDRVSASACQFGGRRHRAGRRGSAPASRRNTDARSFTGVLLTPAGYVQSVARSPILTPWARTATPDCPALDSRPGSAVDRAAAVFAAADSTLASANDGGHGRDASNANAPASSAIVTPFVHPLARDLSFEISLILPSSHKKRSSLFMASSF